MLDADSWVKPVILANGQSHEERCQNCSCVMNAGERFDMCRIEGCYLAGWDICPRCARKQRVALVRERRNRPKPGGEQEKLFGGSPKQQLRWWRNRK